MTVFEEYSLLYYVIVNGALAILVFFTLALFNGLLRQHLQYPRTSKTDSCTSPNCVRCRSAFLDKDALLTKLDKFVSVSNSNPQDLERLFESIFADARASDCVRQRPTSLGLLGLISSAWHNVYTSELQEILTTQNLITIRKEVSKITNDLSKGWVRNTSPSGSWYVFHFYNQGEKQEWNCEECPRTVELVENVSPFMKGCAFGNAVISMVLPGTHITPHYGPTNCRIRCHIPLEIPNGCIICVDQEERTWTEGQPLLFDDSYLHEVWHQGQSGNRIILMLDLWHPEVTVIERQAISYLFSKLNWSVSTHM
jgi:hypothetical protein